METILSKIPQIWSLVWAKSNEDPVVSLTKRMLHKNNRVVKFQSAAKYTKTTVKSYPTKLNPLKVNCNEDSVVKYFTTLYFCVTERISYWRNDVVESQSIAIWSSHLKDWVNSKRFNKFSSFCHTIINGCKRFIEYPLKCYEIPHLPLCLEQAEGNFCYPWNTPKYFLLIL